jgi:CheY-like chemotaxis protein
LDADPTRLAQIVGNILNNACKFTPRNGHIWLTVERGESAKDGSADTSTRFVPHVVIRVRDTGIGIGADQLEHVFDMFTQADTSLERSVTGLGIGLTLVKTLTEMHGGTVAVSSDGVGRGSEFVVRLPIRWKRTRGRPAHGDASVAATLRILIVDDNATQSTCSPYSQVNGTRHLPRTMAAAVEEAATPVDVMLLDIGLPGLNGYEVARRIREQQSQKRRPLLVALTGWGQVEDRLRSEEAGFDAHLVKPVDDVVLGKLLAAFGALTEDERN